MKLGIKTGPREPLGAQLQKIERAIRKVERLYEKTPATAKLRLARLERRGMSLMRKVKIIRDLRFKDIHYLP